MSHASSASGPEAPQDTAQPDLRAHAHSLLGHRVTRAPETVRAQTRHSLGERMADGLATAAGSWYFISGFLVVLSAWMVVNAIAGLRHWDPYPFILLNLALSCMAAIQAPIILMSQNREEKRDRARSEADYQVNLKAEVLLEHLTHEVEALRAALTKEGR